MLDEHVVLFNAGVTSGDFTPMLERFTEDSELVFEGVPVGPFTGRDGIAAAYRDQPPDDEIDVLDAVERDGGLVVARYAWSRTAPTQAGEMRITTNGH